MKASVNLPGSQKYSKIIQWGKLISITGGAQIIVQGLGLVSGIIIIRLLPTQEYALYTLVNTMLGTMTVLADGGIEAGVMAQGGKVWQDREKLGAVIVTGINLRRKFAIGSLAVAIPILFYLLFHNGASILKATIIVITLIPAFTAALSDSLLEITLKLRQDLKPLQKNQIWVNILRLLFIFLLFLSPWAAVAIIAAGVPRTIGNIKLRKLVSKHIDWNQQSDPLVRKDILKGVKRILPGAIYYCVSGQITIWLISIVGNTKSIAQIGALSRLTMLLTLFTTVFNTLITPRFSRLPADKKVLWLKFFQIFAVVALAMAIIIGIVWMFPNLFLLILGHGYSNLSHELVLSVIGSCIGLIAGLLFALSASRGWFLNPIVLIGANLSAIILGCIFLNISTLTGILIFNIIIGIVPIILFVGCIVYQINKLKAHPAL